MKKKISPSMMCSGVLEIGTYLSAFEKNGIEYLHIDVTKGNDYVVFISKSRRSAKIIGYDNKGSILIVRHLDQGRFERLMGAATGPAVKKLTAQELYLYLDGEDIEIKRTHLLKG